MILHDCSNVTECLESLQDCFEQILPLGPVGSAIDRSALACGYVLVYHVYIYVDTCAVGGGRGELQVISFHT